MCSSAISDAVELFILYGLLMISWIQILFKKYMCINVVMFFHLRRCETCELHNFNIFVMKQLGAVKRTDLFILNQVILTYSVLLF